MSSSVSAVVGVEALQPTETSMRGASDDALRSACVGSVSLP